MKRTIVFILLLSTAFVSCKRNKGAAIIGKWRAVQLQNAEMDSFFTQSEHYIDTIGKNNDNATNLALYGATNMDSMRQLLQLQYDSAKSMQLKAVTNTTFDFRTDSTVILSFNGTIDTSKWFFDKDGALQVQDMNVNSDHTAMKWMVPMLSDTALKIIMTDNGASSVVTFHPERK